ncbi:MAG: hypothetical protein COV74_04295 [Candidatus Omnitrophica bacterium CG11_big_fil_rev_8_21_14_0_20_45_26]|uniref:Trm112 family protein n=1 Tax=Candidatus Abzuiibacterium crystallinum TaxID=1974748 RepID=A0A2H0LSF2_9BACT|nr:MAG: hypothetical protein COV74_04295 [Candidatus Omnitrophica bacterium CG11_big_fil_rev_8_21_14_0_20_45_26]PIW63968.1 MAG: hypothetical protein COW12_08685 [Candidatus Omnitrophica bacterium CG12_big_fil_rev_8_21_14_0_65_45_16]
MIDAALLKILACPESKEPLEMASSDLIQKINQQIQQGNIENRGRQKVTQPIDGGLVRRRDRQYLYPIRNDIPVLLIEEAIPLKGI